jgi:hypothetical protein
VRNGADKLSTLQPLTREQAQAIADVLIASDELYSWGIYDDLRERFPDVDWISLCEPDAADPRKRIPPKPFIGPRWPNENARLLDRALADLASGYAYWSQQPTLMGQQIAGTLKPSA